MFSNACKYALRAVIFISNKSLAKERVGFKEVAKEINAPEPFTAKILQKLAKEGIINSTKGVNGGFDIPIEKITTIKLSEIVKLIDGDAIYKECALGLPECSEKQPCPLHHKFKIIRAELIQMLEETSVIKIAEDITKGKSFLKL
ncbi:Rrf2 family transcriptional regulator [Myroides sp. JBRI-B21084]|uniref:RrF2 family transcriptional regulator n=1 Tax=Myroides sp. JBRI-B21084 TaxID=3119977 RepID=UPI0026E39375|nr:Rrf2 family transcriptional regulator [Paenimyroides cloacae]WKW46524.1 Rrf2 family transcriptional regulator [Paenimyroides cloacae]